MCSEFSREVYELINDFLWQYQHTSDVQMQYVLKHRILVSTDLFIKAIVLNLKVRKVEFKDCHALCTSVKQNCLVMEADNEEIAAIRQWFFIPRDREPSFFYVRCLWAYDNAVEAKEKGLFAMLFFRVPFLVLWETEMEQQEIEAMRADLIEIVKIYYPELASAYNWDELEVTEKHTVVSGLMQNFNSLLDKFAQIFNLTTDVIPSYNLKNTIKEQQIEIREWSKQGLYTLLNRKGGSTDEK